MQPSPAHSETVTVDTVIIGGGVAALWTANVLKSKGYSFVVLANGPLGEGQSLAAQGVIHGGLKYAVGGKLTDASEALAEMPSRWLDAIAGRGPVNLSGAELLIDHQVMWSLPNVVSQVVGFFGSKAVRGRSSTIPKPDWPTVFDSPEYKGKLFRIDEPVVDPVSIIRELASNVADETYLVDWNETASLKKGDNGVESIHLKESNIQLKASNYLFAAGAGNADLLTDIGRATPEMQLRPLHQLIVRKPNLPDFFGVCVGTGPKPPIVTTTHVDSEGRKVWYIGGDIAEQNGVARSEAEQIQAGKDWFAKYLSWINLDGAEWFTWRGNRAEPNTGTGDRPPGAYCDHEGNVIVAWPTKLALAPNLADQVLKITSPSHPSTSTLPLPHPPIGKAPWDLP